MHMPCVVQACGWDAASLGLFWKTPAWALAWAGGDGYPPTDLQLFYASGFFDLAVVYVLPWVFSRVELKHLSRKP